MHGLMTLSEPLSLLIYFQLDRSYTVLHVHVVLNYIILNKVEDNFGRIRNSGARGSGRVRIWYM